MVEEDDTTNYSNIEYNKYKDIVKEINNENDFLVSNVLSYFGFKKLTNKVDNDDSLFKYLLGYIPNEDKKYGNSEFIKFLTTPILLIAIFILIAVPQFYKEIDKPGLFWIVIIGLYLLYTIKHYWFYSKLSIQFNTFLEENIYQSKFSDFKQERKNKTFFWYLIESSAWGKLIGFLWVLWTYGILKLIQIATIPGLLAIIISIVKPTDLYYYFSFSLLGLICIANIFFNIRIYMDKDIDINKLNKLNNYNKVYDTYYNDENITKWMKYMHTIFTPGDSAFSSYLFTKTFTLIFGILMFIIGIPVYSIVGSLTLLYVSLNFIYNIVIFPLTKSETRVKIFEIIKENGTLLALIFTGLTINSIYQSHIFGDNNKQIVGIMCAVYAILVFMHIGKNIRKTKNKTE